MKIQTAAERLAKLTQTPSFLHFDIIGFLRISDSDHLNTINQLFNLTGNNGGKLAIPTYSYSFTDREVYDLANSKCTLGKSSEYIRKKNTPTRTTDPIFSYVTFGEGFSRDYYIPRDYETFGEESLIAESFNSDGVLLSVGGKMHFSTEIHFIEKLLNVPYRYDKVFPGTLIDLEGQSHSIKATYYCRDLEFAQKHNLTVSFERLVEDLKESGLIDIIEICDEVQIEVLVLNRLYDFIKSKLKINPCYLMKSI